MHSIQQWVRSAWLRILKKKGWKHAREFNKYVHLKVQVHSKNNLPTIEAEKSDIPIKKKFEQNRIPNKKVMNFLKSM